LSKLHGQSAVLVGSALLHDDEKTFKVRMEDIEDGNDQTF